MRSMRWAVFGLVAMAVVPAMGVPDGVDPGDARSVLECGLAKRYRRDTAQEIVITVSRGGRTLRRYEASVVWKTFDDELRSLVSFREPAEYRRMRVLTVERRQGQDEHFLFLPSLQKVRRVYGGRRAERFLGTDLTYEDWEPIRVEELAIRAFGEATIDGEPVWRITTEPKGESAYPVSRHSIAQSDCLILEIARFKHGASGPSKLIRVGRRDTVQVAGETLPSRILVDDLEAGRQTEVLARHIRLDPELGKEVFEPSQLTRRRDPALPPLSETP